MKRRNHRRTNARRNLDSRGLLRDRHSYRARKSSLNIKAMRGAGKHIRRTGFAGLIDDINR
jgi:hypothetical protein